MEYSQKRTRFTPLIFIITILAGCVATQQVKDTEVLNTGEGILLVGLHTNWEGHDNPLLATLNLLYNGVEDSMLNYGKIAFKGEQHILAAKLPAKDYYFYKLSFGNRSADLKEGSNFTIYPGKITYIGSISTELDLGLFSASGVIQVNNNLAEAKKYLEKNYPNLAKGKEIVKSIITMEMEE